MRCINGDMSAKEFKIYYRILAGSDEETALVNAVQISSRIYETIFSEIFQSVNFLSVS